MAADRDALVRASEVARISAGHDSVWRMLAEQDEAYNAPGHGLLDAIAAATPRGLDGSLYAALAEGKGYLA